MRILPVSAQDRIEKDSLGEIRVAAGALWGAQTQRAADNFRIGRDRMPAELIRAIGLIKWAAAETNGELGELPAPLAAAIAAAALEVAAGRPRRPVSARRLPDRLRHQHQHERQRGASPTSRAASLGQAVHANDHVNRCQSSNDVIPTAIHVAAALAVRDALLPALRALAAAIGAKAGEVGDQVKAGRTHLMDALPVTVGQEMTAWQSQVADAIARIDAASHPAAPARARRDGRRHRRQRASGVRGARDRAPRRAHRHRIHRRAGPLCEPGGAGHVGRAVRERCAAPRSCCSRSRTTCAG